MEVHQTGKVRGQSHAGEFGFAARVRDPKGLAVASGALVAARLANHQSDRSLKRRLKLPRTRWPSVALSLVIPISP